jgi:hypothetical protein
MNGVTELGAIVERRLEGAARAWFAAACAEAADSAGAPDALRFSHLLSLASRHARDSMALAPDALERAAVARSTEGVEIERWTLLETVRVALVLARPDLAADSGQVALEEAFRYADEGELRALYRSLALLPAPERFLWRAGEGCRTNMRSVFEAAALDTPYPVRWFDDVAWRSVAIKCVFVGAPLSRLVGLDSRLSPELARMTLDLVDERRSAGRAVQPDLWLCLGTHGGERGRASLLRELAVENPERIGRQAAAFGLSRAGEQALARRLSETERDPKVRSALLAGAERPVEAGVFRSLEDGGS